MLIETIDEAEVLRISREALALPPDPENSIDACFLAALVRRAAAMRSPCAPGTLTRTVVEALRDLAPDIETLALEVEAAIDAAVVAGDLLELSQVTTDDPNTKGTWLFAAPPAFVLRPNGRVILMGIVPERPHPLPPPLAAKLNYHRYLRALDPGPGEDLPESLREIGLLEMSEEAWLRMPRPESASALRSRLEAQLRALPPSGEIPELQLIDPTRPSRYYRGRWTTPKGQSGTFVARRPQAYGAAIWGFALLHEGAVMRFLDFPLRKDRWRGSDAAWHLQMAIDHLGGNPQRYRYRADREAVLLDFFGPLPLWAQRRLATLGEPIAPDRALMSFKVPRDEAPAEERFLQERLWLARDEGMGEA